MSERELNRIEVLSDVAQGRMSAVAAASVLGPSRRQVHRLLKTFQADGPAAIRHKARGRPSNNRIDPAVREFALTLIRARILSRPGGICACPWRGPAPAVALRHVPPDGPNVRCLQEIKSNSSYFSACTDP